MDRFRNLSIRRTTYFGEDGERAGNEVQERIAGLMSSSDALLPVDGDLVTFIRSLSKGQLSDALIAIAQQMGS